MNTQIREMLLSQALQYIDQQTRVMEELQKQLTELRKELDGLKNKETKNESK